VALVKLTREALSPAAVSVVLPEVLGIPIQMFGRDPAGAV
jgi:hypothetical protein